MKPGPRIPKPVEAFPRGFKSAATACGLKKKDALDLAVISCDALATAAAVFTTNLVKAAPVLLCQEHLRRTRGRARAIVVNSGNANCCTGDAGMRAARATARAVARKLDCRPEEVLVCSTGVIGVALPVRRILYAIPRIIQEKTPHPRSFAQVGRAIMTTDTRPKFSARSCRIGGSTVRVAGCAKGAGMIHPQMATMLAFIVTDAALSPALLRRTLRDAVKDTFNAITVDGDTSTNDTVAALASGASGAAALRAGTADYLRFARGLEGVCRELALKIVGDGEGAQHVVEIEVRNAPDDRAADRVARTIAHSPLVKTALAGADPNWGRILAAAGRAGVAFNPARASITLAGIPVFRRGKPVAFDERKTHALLLRRSALVRVDLGAGRGRASVVTCDLTAEYVHINADYRS
jgi:glutamate N-acetyltransferase / amino-acid N-acetyltransferase